MFIFLLLLVSSRVVESLEVNDILKELSWPLRLKILNELTPGGKVQHIHDKLNVETTTEEPTLLPVKVSDATEPPLDSSSDVEITITTLNTESNTNTNPISPVTTTSSNLTPEPIGQNRRVGIQSLKTRRDKKDDDDKDMRLKLFRLMYETVRDSDLKVKRAELIKDHYTNSTVFEIGYLIGEITDKANIITDISVTVQKFQKDWKPIEHINAYEQISNQAIEITHLIGLVKVLNKRDGGANVK